MNEVSEVVSICGKNYHVIYDCDVYSERVEMWANFYQHDKKGDKFTSTLGQDTHTGNFFFSVEKNNFPMLQIDGIVSTVEILPTLKDIFEPHFIPAMDEDGKGGFEEVDKFNDYEIVLEEIFDYLYKIKFKRRCKIKKQAKIIRKQVVDLPKCMYCGNRCISVGGIAGSRYDLRTTTCPSCCIKYYKNKKAEKIINLDLEEDIRDGIKEEDIPKDLRERLEAIGEFKQINIEEMKDLMAKILYEYKCEGCKINAELDEDDIEDMYEVCTCHEEENLKSKKSKDAIWLRLDNVVSGIEIRKGDVK